MGWLGDSMTMLDNCGDKSVNAGQREAVPFVCGLEHLTGTGADLKGGLGTKNQ